MFLVPFLELESTHMSHFKQKNILLCLTKLLHINGDPIDRRRLPTVVLMLVHRLRRWPNIRTTVGQRVCMCRVTSIHGSFAPKGNTGADGAHDYNVTISTRQGGNKGWLEYVTAIPNYTPLVLDQRHGSNIVT